MNFYVRRANGSTLCVPSSFSLIQAVHERCAFTVLSCSFSPPLSFFVP